MQGRIARSSGGSPECERAEGHRLEPTKGKAMKRWHTQHISLHGTQRPPYTHSIHGRILALEDLGVGRSVTHDAQRVLQDLANQGLDLTQFRVIYRDATGRWDELLVDKGAFAGFAPLGATSLADAIARIRGTR